MKTPMIRRARARMACFCSGPELTIANDNHLRLEFNAVPLFDLGAGEFDERLHVGRGSTPVDVDDEVRVQVGEHRSALPPALQSRSLDQFRRELPGRIDERASEAAFPDRLCLLASDGAVVHVLAHRCLLYTSPS